MLCDLIEIGNALRLHYILALHFDIWGMPCVIMGTPWACCYSVYALRAGIMPCVIIGMPLAPFLSVNALRLLL